MLVHAVFFWLKPDLTADQRARFVTGVNSLLSISSVVHGSVGTPASTDRPVIDRTYSYGLLTVFKDLEGHDTYQVDPIHLAFISACKDYWTRVQIYDFE
jgi:hypothetical protein